MPNNYRILKLFEKKKNYKNTSTKHVLRNEICN